MTTAIVLGASGFLGRCTAGLLKREGWDVIGLDNRVTREVEYANITEVTDGITEYFRHCDYVIHLAALAIPNYCASHPRECFDVNVRGTYNVLKLSADADVKKVVFMSSGHVYGISPKYMPTDEHHPIVLQDDVYTETKILGERLCWLFYENRQLSFTTLRLFNGYGPGQTTGYFIPDMIKKARTDKKIVLRGAKTTKDFVFMDDVATVILKALQTSYIGEINIGSGKETPLEYIASFIANELGATMELDVNQPNVTRMWADNRRARKILGWQPTVSLETGLKATIG